MTEAHRLLHGGESQVWGMLVRGSREKVGESGVGVGLAGGYEAGAAAATGSGSNAALTEKRKASIRAKVEHPFLKVKQLFGYAKVRYRGLAKNTQRLALLLGLGNLLTAESRLAA